jgi:transcriptional regulator with PAS, ATPase and Fis domain
VPPLTVQILEKLNRTNRLTKRLAPEILDSLVRYHYPGNVRELINLLERMIIMSDGDLVTPSDMPLELKEASLPVHAALGEGLSLKEALAAAETNIVTLALRKHATLSKAARALAIHPSTLWRKMVKHGLLGRVAETQ